MTEEVTKLFRPGRKALAISTMFVIDEEGRDARLLRNEVGNVAPRWAD